VLSDFPLSSVPLSSDRTHKATAAAGGPFPFHSDYELSGGLAAVGLNSVLISFHRGQGSIILRVKIRDSSVATGAGLTGLTNSSTGLVISTIADNENAATVYTAAGATIDSITTLGTFAAPTTAHCRFKQVDATNHKGVYEIQLADARFGVSSAKFLLVSISGPTNCAECDALIPLTDMDPYNATTGGLGNLDAAISSRSTYAGGDTSGTTTLLARLTATRAGNLDNLDATISSRMATFTLPAHFSSLVISTGGQVDANLAKILGTVVTETNAGQIAGGFNRFFDVTTPAGTINLIPEVSQVDLVQGDIHGSLTGSVGTLASSALSGVEQAVWFSAWGPNAIIDQVTTGNTGTLTTIILSTSPGADDCIKGMTLVLTSGPGAPAVRTIIGYVAATKTATVDRPFLTAPDSLTSYVIKRTDAPRVNASLEVTTGALAAAAKTDVENAVWNASMASHTTAGTTGASLNAAGSTGDPLATAVPGSYAAGTVGYIIGHNLDAAVSSRSTYAGADTAGTTTLLSRLTAGRATNLDNLDATVSSRLASTSYVTPPTTAQLATALWTDLLSGSDFATAGSIGKLLKDDVDAAISSRSTYAGADTAGTTTLLSRLTAGRATNLDNVDATVSSRMATFTLPANFGALGIGLTGHILNVDTINDARLAHLDADVSSRSTYAGADTSGTTTLLSRLTATRAGNLDNLDATISSLGSPMQAGTVTLAATQPNYAPAKAGDAMTLAAGERTAVATALLDLANGVETNVTLRQALRVLAADVGGKRSNVGTLNEQYDALGNPGTPRLVANLDGSGNGTPTITP
jgi:hypothetical protein